MSDIELAWAAGLFDGEGSVFASHTRLRPNHVRLNIALVMTERAVVQRFCDAISYGYVYEIARKTVTGKTAYRYQSQRNETVKDVLRLLWPYLSVPKKIQALYALAERVAYERTKR